MAKIKSKTDELLKKLGASLKTSPLQAHARGVESWRAGEGAQNTEPAPAVRVEKAPVRKINTEPMQMGVAVGQGTGVNPVARSLEAMKRIATTQKAAVRSEKRSEAIWSNEAEPAKTEKTDAESALKAVKENGNLVEQAQMAKAMASLSETQVKALQTTDEQARARVTMQGGVPTADAMRELLEKTGAPMSAAQLDQWREMQAMRKMIAEIRERQEKMYGAQAQTPSAQAPAKMAAPVTTYVPQANGSQRNTANGWRTSTVGMYPEDYDKAYEIMNYIRAQTGQNVNLSRVVKIALRALEVGPQVLEVNAQIRQKDGRLMARR